jgi:CNT family concentrative nucleoside transporter
VTSDIFLGPTEAPLTVRPYVEKMTDSELFTVMVGGLASVAGSTLVGYSLLGAPLNYLLAAAFMSAPAALLMAKIMMPETEEPESRTPDPEDEALLQEVLDDRNVIDAAARGAADGLRLALNVGAMLIAFISLIALLNLILGAIGGLFGFEELSLQLILGYVFARWPSSSGYRGTRCWTRATSSGRRSSSTSSSPIRTLVRASRSSPRRLSPSSPSRSPGSPTSAR